jgi:hypothetical protein
MSGLAARLDGALDVSPKILPFFLGPAVITLKTRDSVSEAIAHQFPIRIVLGVKISGGHSGGKIDDFVVYRGLQRIVNNGSRTVFS